MLVSTKHWYGLYRFDNTIVEQKFFDIIEMFANRFYYDIVNWYQLNTEFSNVDLMCKVFEGDDYNDVRNFNAKLFVLAVSYYACEKDMLLHFSDMTHKYYFYKKIDEIVLHVVNKIKELIGKKYVISLSIFIIFLLIGYKCAECMIQRYS
jgi:hypothetical protein